MNDYMTFSAAKLLETLQVDSGSYLVIRWKPRTFQKPKRLYEIQLSNGLRFRIQPSAVCALIGMGKVVSSSFLGTTTLKIKE